MAAQLVVAIFDSYGIARDARNRLHTEGVPHGDVSLKVLREVAPPPPSLEPTLEALEVDPLMFGNVRANLRPVHPERRNRGDGARAYRCRGRVRGDDHAALRTRSRRDHDAGRGSIRITQPIPRPWRRAEGPRRTAGIRVACPPRRAGAAVARGGSSPRSARRPMTVRGRPRLAAMGVGCPRRLRAAVAPMPRIAAGLTSARSISSHQRQASISPASGRLCSRRLPRHSYLKCLTALVT